MGRLGEIEGATQALGERGVLRFFTAGSVDDGKSTLIGRLLHDTQALFQDQLAAVARVSRHRGFAAPDLSLFTDGLEAEREQGITIDVAYRYFATARRKFIVADTPGHVQYTRNMATGASTADAAVILVDATKGLLAQSRRHLLVAHLLGIRHVVVAVNKIDLALFNKGSFEGIRDQFERFAAPLGVPDLRFVPVSALQGDMVAVRGDRLGWYTGPTLLETLESIETGDGAASRPFRFPVQYVSRTAAGATGRGYMGRIAAGSIAPGDELVALPSGYRTRVKDILSHETGRAAAHAGDSVTLVLEDELDISRGDLLADPKDRPATLREFDATLVWMGNEPLDPAGRYLAKHTTRTVRVRIPALLERIDIRDLQRKPVAGPVSMNDIVRARLFAQQPLFADRYLDSRSTGSFILIDEATNHTVAAGMIE